MKRTILINQEILSRISSDLDFNDGAILHYMIDFSHLAKKMTDLGHSWFWVATDKLILDMPMLKISSKRGIANRIDKLIDSDLLVRHPENQTSGRSFYRFGEKYQFLIAWNENSTLGKSVPSPLENSFQAPMNETSDYNSINDNSIRDKKGSTDEKSVSPSLFPEQDKSRKTLFRNSLVADFEKFKNQFAEVEFKNVDLFFYFNAVKDWSDQKDMKRTGVGWIATARTWMRNDLQKGALKTLNGNGKDENDYQEYLKMSHESNY